MNKNEITICVVLGGTSPERAVSKQSGKSLYNAVKKLGYNVRIVDPAYGLNQPQNIEDYFAECDCGILSNENYINAVNSSLFDNVDLVLIALHGKWGEDGTIQSLFELKGIKYTGSGVLGSSLTMDKARSKVMFTHFGVSTPKWIEAKKNISIEELDKQITENLNYPCIIKPNDQGSTLGLTKCNSKNELADAFELASQFSNTILIEEFIEGREISVGIIHDQILPLLEIKPKHELYDYECKYTDGMSEYIVPANIDVEIEAEVKKQAKLAFESLGCKDYGRIDFRVTDQGVPYCFEVNTLPGMTSHSLVPKMAKASGIEFEELVDLIIESSL
ncbi:MAG: D-alanine--D-alanine ligase [Ignavibacteriae bacterium]|nr:D-alanine--D-alanine ligase [Ignavibacteriota bacterium]